MDNRLLFWSETQDKLSEAAYFLDQMRASKNDEDRFRYELSAFVSAARSVTLVMQTEYDARPGFKEWYAERQAQMAKDSAFALFNEKRVITIHKSSLRLRGEHRMEMTATVRPTASLEIQVINADGTIRHISPVSRRRLRRLRLPRLGLSSRVSTWYFADAPTQDVITMSEEYLTKLRVIVERCTEMFGSPASWGG